MLKVDREEEEKKVAVSELFPWCLLRAKQNKIKGLKEMSK